MEEEGPVIKCTVCQESPSAPRLFPCGHVICTKCLAHLISNGYDENGDPKKERQTRCPTCHTVFVLTKGDIEPLPIETFKITTEVKDKENTQHEPVVITRPDKPIENKGISFTDSSKKMLPPDDSKKRDVASVSTNGSISSTSEGADTNKVPEQPSKEVAKLEQMDARLPMQNLVTVGALQNGLVDRSATPPVDEGEQISLSDDNQSTTSTELNNFCTICRLSGKYVTSSRYCVSCGCLVCTSCAKIHMEHAPDREHVLVTLTSDNLNTVLCRSHDQLIRFFCLTCCATVCKACLMEHHTQHKMSDFTNSEGENITTKQLGFHIQTHLKDLRTQKRSLTKAQEVTEMNRRDVNMQIIKCIDSQIRYLQEMRQDLVDRSDQYHGQVKEEMHIVEREVDRATVIMQNLQVNVDTSLYPLPPHSQVIPAVFPINILQRKFSSIALPSKDSKDFGVRGCRYQQGAAPDAGKLMTGIAISSNDLAQINMSKTNRKVKVKVLWNKAVEVQDLHFLPQSKDLLFTDIGKGYTMHKLNCDGKLAPLLVGLSGFAGRECVFGINKYTGFKVIGYKPEPKGNDIVLSVFNADLNTTDVNLIGATFPPGYNTLVTLTISQNHDILAALSDHGDNPNKTCICCFDLNGHLLWLRNTSPSSRAGDLAYPVFITMDKLDRIIVSDRDGGKVNIYTSDGSHLLSFPQVKDEDGEIIRLKPTGICLDTSGRILVAFFDLQVVSLFTPNGAFIRHVVQTPGPPWGISLCGDNRFMIVALESHGLWLYDLVDIDG